MSKENKKEIFEVGAQFGEGLRETSRYTDTQVALIVHGLTELVLNQTPPVGLNLKILIEQMPQAMHHVQQLPDNPLVALFGLAIAGGVDDVHKLVNLAGKHAPSELSVVDIDQAIITEVDALHRQNVKTFHEDARRTSLAESQQHFVIRDHLGNCCPPEMYEAIESEVLRVLAPNGLSLVNITSSEKILTSRNRQHISLAKLRDQFPEELIRALRSRIFSLSQLAQEFPAFDVSNLQGCLLEINPNSFVIFGEDAEGHGEWFSDFNFQLQ
ncbi:hypothetical protein KBC89_05545, partial [Candidatus Woesebacteria bacterium]|nr:hypothetical protein [Candidatus Woesebacteria bacterium]